MGLAYYDGYRYKEVEKVFDKMQKIKGTQLIFNKKNKNIFYYLEKNFLTIDLIILLQPYRVLLKKY